MIKDTKFTIGFAAVGVACIAIDIVLKTLYSHKRIKNVCTAIKYANDGTINDVIAVTSENGIKASKTWVTDQTLKDVLLRLGYDEVNEVLIKRNKLLTVRKAIKKDGKRIRL